MWRQSLLFLVFCAILSGCAARESVSPTTSTPETVPAAQSFNEQVAALPEGATQYFAESPFGPASIEAGAPYLSGLGNECRSARVTRGTMSHRFAFCKEEKGNWRFLPTIFESMPR
ncbi:hypothetical protein HMPREF1022_02949 [Desulfovibrio sp. 6_1_46AFAA]|uniref:DVU3141 family protein n=1 Tax=Desulfovibrio sp. 6_1_46AFAA TaxID=665942 RepID=UPI0002236E09|nr:DVU3141 family protein [Desulfovibrio sp. 6_1_46AFAA]EGW50006.1 hypothetical protein HMPREF1022_02949 [Desulfovibrio sp. 6_1_46AFAA]